MGGFSDIIFSYLQFQLYISFIYFKLQPVENDFRGNRQIIGDSKINLAFVVSLDGGRVK